MGDWVCVVAGAVLVVAGVFTVRRSTEPVGAYVGMGCFGSGLMLVLFGVLRMIATVHP